MGWRRMSEEEHIIAVITEHKPGVLFQVANMIRRRNFNIETISVGQVDTDIARMTITLRGDRHTVEQVVKQLSKLVSVIKISEIDPRNSIIRELALIKTHAPSTSTRNDIIQYANIFRARIVDVSPDSLVVEITGTSDKIDAFLDLMRGFGVKEIARTGITALVRGARTVKVE